MQDKTPLGPELTRGVRINRAAHEDLHTDPRTLRYTSATTTITDGEESLRMPLRRSVHLGNFWWGVESADSANAIELRLTVSGVDAGAVSLQPTLTESDEVFLDWHPQRGDHLRLTINGTITDAGGPWWAEIDVFEVFT